MAGTLWELDAIAATCVGGVSSAGGIGISYQSMLRGAVLAVAVIFDVAIRTRGK